MLLVTGIVVFLAASAALVVVAVGRWSDEGADIAARQDEGPGGSLAPDATPAEVFAHGALVLNEAGTFSYEATNRIELTGLPGGGGTQVITQDLSGDVVLPDTVHELSDDGEGLHTERIAIGTGPFAEAWTRRSVYEDALGERPWAELDGGRAELELYSLPEWLEGAVDHRDGGEDRNGRRVVHAGVPVSLIGDLGGGEFEVIDASIEMTLDDDDLPRKIVLDVATRDIVIEGSYDLRGVGDEITIDPPGRDQLDPTPWFNEEDIAAFDGPPPLGLSGVPEGWELAGASVSLDQGEGCESATIDYADISDPMGNFLWLNVMNVDCAPPSVGEPFDVAGFEGTVTDLDDGTRVAILTSADTAVVVVTDLLAADLRAVLQTLGPLDLEAEPTPLAGIPSAGT